MKFVSHFIAFLVGMSLDVELTFAATTVRAQIQAFPETCFDQREIKVREFPCALKTLSAGQVAQFNLFAERGADFIFTSDRVVRLMEGKIAALNLKAASQRVHKEKEDSHHKQKAEVPQEMRAITSIQLINLELEARDTVLVSRFDDQIRILATGNESILIRCVSQAQCSGPESRLEGGLELALSIPEHRVLSRTERLPLPRLIDVAVVAQELRSVFAATKAVTSNAVEQLVQVTLRQKVNIAQVHAETALRTVASVREQNDLRQKRQAEALRRQEQNRRKNRDRFLNDPFRFD